MKPIFCLLVIVIFITQRTCSGQCQPCQDKYDGLYNECVTRFYGDCQKTDENCEAACPSLSCQEDCAAAYDRCIAPHTSDFDACVNFCRWGLSDCIAKTCP